MSDDSSKAQADLLAQQAAFFESYFKKGAEFTRELMQETQRLRARLAELEEQLDVGRDRELEERYQQIEKENNDLAALYVAQSQLHSSLEVGEVIQVTIEVLLNFVGAEEFCLYTFDTSEVLRPLRAVGVAESALSSKPGELSRVREAVEGGRVSNGGLGPAKPEEAPVCVIPLQNGSEKLGAIAIWRYLQQKEEVTFLDQQLFDLLASGAGLALQAALIVSEGRLRLPQLEAAGMHERVARVL